MQCQPAALCDDIKYCINSAKTAQVKCVVLISFHRRGIIDVPPSSLWTNEMVVRFHNNQHRHESFSCHVWDFAA